MIIEALKLLVLMALWFVGFWMAFLFLWFFFGMMVNFWKIYVKKKPEPSKEFDEFLN